MANAASTDHIKGEMPAIMINAAVHLEKAAAFVSIGDRKAAAIEAKKSRQWIALLDRYQDILDGKFNVQSF